MSEKKAKDLEVEITVEKSSETKNELFDQCYQLLKLKTNNTEINITNIMDIVKFSMEVVETSKAKPCCGGDCVSMSHEHSGGVTKSTV